MSSAVPASSSPQQNQATASSSSSLSHATHLHTLVLSQLQCILESMRKNRKWKTTPNEFHSDKHFRPPYTLLRQLDELRWKFTLPHVLTLDRAAILQPFLSLVTSHETSGHLTCLGLNAVEMFVKNGLFEGVVIEENNGAASAPAASPSAANFDITPFRRIIHALTHCRFEPSDSTRDELVLHHLLGLTRTCITSPIGKYLSNSDIWKLIKNVYSIRMRLEMTSSGGSGEVYSPVLIEYARETLHEVIRWVVIHVKEMRKVQAASANFDSSSLVYSSAAFNSSSPYSYHVLYKIFQLLNTLGESIHTDLNIAFKIDLIHGRAVGIEEQQHQQQPQPPSASRPQIDEEVIAVPSTIPTIQDTVPANLDASSSVTTDAVIVASSGDSDSSTPAPLSSTSLSASPLPTPSQSPPPILPTSASSTSITGAATPHTHSHHHHAASTLPAYTSHAYRSLLPLNELHSLDFFSLSHPTTAALTAGPGVDLSSTFVAATLNVGLIGAVASASAALEAKHIQANWTRRASMTLSLIELIFNTLNRDLIYFTELSDFLADNWMKFLMKSCSVFSQMNSWNTAPTQATTNTTQTTLNLHLFTRSLNLIQTSITYYRDRVPMQLDMIVQNIFIRVLKMRLQAIQPPGSTHATAAASGLTSPAPAASATPSAASSSAQQTIPYADTQTISTLYELKEIVLESLLDLCSSSWFISELFVNYDCRIGEHNLCELLIRELIGNSTPRGLKYTGDPDDKEDTASSSAKEYTQNNYLSYRCLCEVMKIMEGRAENAAAVGVAGVTTSPSTMDMAAMGTAAAAAAANASSPIASPATSSTPSSTSPSSSSPRNYLDYVDTWFQSFLPITDIPNMITNGEWSLPKLSLDAKVPLPPTLSSQLLSHLHHSRLTKHILHHCISRFNIKSKRADLSGFTQWFHMPTLERWQELKKDVTKKDTLPDDVVQDIRSFVRLMRLIPSFDKHAIAAFLHDSDPFSSHVRRIFVQENFSFVGETLDDALRMFLEATRLPVETQQIDRCIEAFAEGYATQNPGAFFHTDGAHTLAFSLIILNTDLHNKLVKNKMTLPGFIKINRGIDSGVDIPPLWLQTLYYSIKYNEIRQSGVGMDGTGELTDALWRDCLIQSKKKWKVNNLSATSMTSEISQLSVTSATRAYIRLDYDDPEYISQIDANIRNLIDGAAADAASSTSIIPASLRGSVPVVHEPVASSSSSPSSLLPHLLTLFTDHSIYSTISSPLLSLSSQLFSSHLTERMIAAYDARVQSERIQVMEEEERRRERAMRDGQSMGVLPATRQSSIESDYYTVNTPGDIDEDELNDTSSHRSNSLVSSHSPRPNGSSSSLITLASSIPASSFSSLVPTLYSVFHSLATIASHSPRCYQNRFDAVINIFTRFVSPPPLARAMNQAMGVMEQQNLLSQQQQIPPTQNLGDLLPSSSRSTILARKYAALLSLGGSTKSVLCFTWLFQCFTHELTLLSSFRIMSWAEITGVMSYLLYLDLLGSSPSDSTSQQHGGGELMDAHDGLGSNHLEDFVAEWKEKNRQIQLHSAVVPVATEHSDTEDGEIDPQTTQQYERRDLLSYRPSHSLSSSSSASSAASNGGLGSSFLGFFFASSSSDTLQDDRHSFKCSPDMKQVEEYLLQLIKSCNLSYTFLEQSRRITYEALTALCHQLMQEATIKNAAVYAWKPDQRMRSDSVGGGASANANSNALPPVDANSSSSPAKKQSIRKRSIHEAPLTAPAHSSTTTRVSILPASLLEEDVFDSSIYIDLGEETHVASVPREQLSTLSPAHSLHMHLSPHVHTTCSCCFKQDYLSIPFELRRCIFFMDFLAKVVKENTWRMVTGSESGSTSVVTSTSSSSSPPRLWSTIRNWLIGMILSEQNQSQPKLIAAGLVALLSILTHIYHRETMRKDCMQTLRSIIGSGGTHMANHQQHVPSSPSSAAHSYSGSLHSKQISYFLNHSSISSQLVCGLHLFIQTHIDSITSSEDWECILYFLQHTAHHEHAFFHGFAILWMLIMSPASYCNCVSLGPNFQVCVSTLLVFARSRYCSPVYTLKIIDLCEQMFNHLRTKLYDERIDVMQEYEAMQKQKMREIHVGELFSNAQTSSMAATPNPAASSPLPSTSSPATSTSTPTTTTPPHRILLQHIWSCYVHPLFHALRSITACCTDRIRVMYNIYHFTQKQHKELQYKQQQEQSASTNAFGTRRSPSSTSPSSTAGSHYVIYIKEFEHVRQQAVLLLKQVLGNDILPISIWECIKRCSSSGVIKDVTAGVNVHPAIAHSASDASFQSWTLSTFWQLSLDEILFPLLTDLSHSKSLPLFLESSTSFTLLRTLAVSILSKVFLRQCHGAVSANNNIHSNIGFTRTWLNVLKTLDRYMQLGIQIMQRQEQSLSAANGGGAAAANVSTHTFHRAQLPSSSGAVSSSHSAAIGTPVYLFPITGIEWSPESGIQLTETVAEVLSNIVLVMKSQGCFGPVKPTQPSIQSAPPVVPISISVASPSAPSVSSPLASDPTPASSELWLLTQSILQPWVRFLPSLQNELMPPQIQQQQHPQTPTQTQQQQQQQSTTSTNSQPAAPQVTSPHQQQEPLVL